MHRRGLRHAHELLLSTTLGEPLEVAADRGAHVVEVALLAHGRVFPGAVSESC